MTLESQRPWEVCTMYSTQRHSSSAFVQGQQQNFCLRRTMVMVGGSNRSLPGFITSRELHCITSRRDL